MPGERVRIICDRAAAPAPPGDLHDEAGHHRYYGSTATNGERIAETRRSRRPRPRNVCGF